MITKEDVKKIKIGDQFTLNEELGKGLWTVVKIGELQIDLENNTHDKRYIHDGSLKCWNSVAEKIVDLI